MIIMHPIANDNAPDPKLTFHPFARWCAIALGTVPQGYMSHFDGETTLHLRKDAPGWLLDVRDAGPWPDNGTCQEAVKSAMPEPMFFQLTGG